MPSRIVAVAVMGVIGAGCAVTGGKAPRTFDLTAASGFPSTVGRTGAHIVVMTPRALAALDNEKILVRQDGGEISYYPGARWSARLARLFQSRLTQAFENTRRVRAVGQQGDGIAADYLVVMEIRSFEYDVSEEKAVQVAVFVKLISDRSGRVVASKLFEEEALVAGDTVDAIVAALDGAFQSVQRDIVRFTLERI